MKTAYIWIFFTCLLCITCSKKEERSAVQMPIEKSTFNSPLVGAWWFSSQEGGIFQIVFYPDRSYRSNVGIGVGTYDVLPTIIKFASPTGKLDFQYTLQGETLWIKLPIGNVPFRRVSDRALSLLRGRYCGSVEEDIPSPYQTVLEFDGRGGYSTKVDLGLYWVDGEGVHLIFQYDGYWAQKFFPITTLGNDGTIIMFEGGDGTFTRCK